MAASRHKKSVLLEPSPRHLWLASLGVLVAAQRESRVLVRRASTKFGDAVADARYALRRAEAGIDGMRDQVAPKVQQFSHDVEARLAPIVAKLGLKTQRGARKGRKPAAKSGARRTARKAASRVAKKAAR